MICDSTRYYIRPIEYASDEERVVIDNKEVTKNLPDEVMFVNDKIMFSFDTIQKYFDKYIYFDEKYNTVIVTNEVDVVKLELDKREININGDIKPIVASAYKHGEDIYIPIEELEETYNIDVTKNEKIIISTQNVNYKKVETESKGKIKLYKRELSLTNGKFKTNDVITIFDEDNDSEYVYVRTANGDLGYIKREKINGNIVFNNEIKETRVVDNKKINLTWDYAENYTQNRSNEAKIEGLDVVSPTWIYVKNISGDIKYDTLSEEYIKWAKKQGYKLWPILKNDGLKTIVTKGQDAKLEGTSKLVTDMKSRERLINNVVEIALKYGFEGINLDFEYMKKEDRDEFSQFVREFSAVLRRNGLVSSVDVNVPDGSDNWSLCYDQKPISDACDYMILMAYDQYGVDKDGPVASLSWVENNIKKLIEREEVDSSKFILGVPFYSKYRMNKIQSNNNETNIKKSSIKMSDAKKYMSSSKYKNFVVWNEDMGQYYIEYINDNTVERIWVEEEKALAKKVELVNKYDLAGVASWRLDYETDEAWKVINNTLKK